MWFDGLPRTGSNPVILSSGRSREFPTLSRMLDKIGSVEGLTAGLRFWLLWAGAHRFFQ